MGLGSLSHSLRQNPSFRLQFGVLLVPLMLQLATLFPELSCFGLFGPAFGFFYLSSLQWTKLFAFLALAVLLLTVSQSPFVIFYPLFVKALEQFYLHVSLLGQKHLLHTSFSFTYYTRHEDIYLW